MTDDDMKLPAGKTCGDCESYYRCFRLFGCPETNTTCDWSPSRFVLQPVSDKRLGEAIRVNGRKG